MVHRWYEGASTIAPHGTGGSNVNFFTICIFYYKLKNHVIKFDTVA